MATTWDTDADAEQFEAAYLASLSARFSAGQAARAGAVTTHPRPTGGAVAVKRQGKDVYIADAARAGVDPTKLVAALSKTKKTKHPSDK
jgi:hypothetical protein